MVWVDGAFCGVNEGTGIADDDAPGFSHRRASPSRGLREGRVSVQSSAWLAQ